jgi:hypothetical protein
MDSHRVLRHVLGLTLGAVACVVTLHAQAPGAPAFEVASIRENVSASDNASVRAQPGGRVSVTNNSLRNIMRNAYNVQNYQIIGGPDWINTAAGTSRQKLLTMPRRQRGRSASSALSEGREIV